MLVAKGLRRTRQRRIRVQLEWKPTRRHAELLCCLFDPDRAEIAEWSNDVGPDEKRPRLAHDDIFLRLRRVPAERAAAETFGIEAALSASMPIEPNAYRREWASWLPEALPLLEREEYKDALKTFPRPQLAALPLRPAPADRRIVLISTGGAFDHQTQAPFDAQSAIGDMTHRIFPEDLADERIALRHGHYDAAPAEVDREVLLPRRALRDAGATLAANVISTMGYCLDWPSFIDQTIPQIVAQARTDGATCALLVPV
ncbi:MAG: hypothetical protein M3169_16085 [Candidatus Eremiobacteraeota bacterium]|nr:hypothetical protein [Candidatus Eremiobacteraeota bacterium]